MPNFIFGSSVGMVIGIKVCACSDAALGEVSELVDVTAVELSRIESFDYNFEVCGSELMFLVYGDDALDTRIVVGVEDADGGASLFYCSFVTTPTRHSRNCDEEAQYDPNVHEIDLLIIGKKKNLK